MTCLEKELDKELEQHRCSQIWSCTIGSPELEYHRGRYEALRDLYNFKLNNEMTCLNSGHIHLQCEGKCRLLKIKEMPIILNET